MTFSLCIYTRGPAARIRALLALCRPHFDEIVLAVDRSGDAGTLESCADLADRRFLVESAPMAAVLGWLLHRCSGDWILRLDEDEVPSRSLLDGLPALVSETWATHVVLRRRWLFPSVAEYVTTHPWHPDHQVRLVRNVPGVWTFPGLTHEAMRVGGERTLCDLPLYHANCILSPLDSRLRRREGYERLRPGLRTDGFPVNDMYVPEMHDVETATVPEADVRAIAAVLEAVDGEAPSRALSEVVEVPDGGLDRLFGGRAVRPGAYRAAVRLVALPTELPAGELRHHEVVVENHGEEWWTPGAAEPPFQLGCRWRHRLTGEAVPPEGRAPFTETVRPGMTTRLMLGIPAPAVAGDYVLEVDVVHELVRWFGCGAEAPVTVTATGLREPA